MQSSMVVPSRLFGVMGCVSHFFKPYFVIITTTTIIVEEPSHFEQSLRKHTWRKGVESSHIYPSVCHHNTAHHWWVPAAISSQGSIKQSVISIGMIFCFFSDSPDVTFITLMFCYWNAVFVKCLRHNMENDRSQGDALSRVRSGGVNRTMGTLLISITASCPLCQFCVGLPCRV